MNNVSVCQQPSSSSIAAHLFFYLQTTTGVACATFPTSSSACMIFLIRATGNLQTLDFRPIL